MALWRLTPIDLNDRTWLTSEVRDILIVRAPDALTARETAGSAFGIVPQYIPGEDPPLDSPWIHVGLVKAEEIEDDRFQSEGPTEVLDPSKARQLWIRMTRPRRQG